MKKIVFCLCLLGAAIPAAGAEPALDIFNRANALYAQGNYTEAIAAYESLTARREVNAALYYNLGNAYYRNRQVGRAVLNYERAARLSPRDGDIRGNLAFVRTLVKEPVPGFFGSLADGIAAAASVNELATALTALNLCLAGGIIGFLLTKYRPLIIVNLGLVLAVILCAGWLALAVGKAPAGKAVVVAGPAEARNGPGLENSVAFVMPEGRAVVMLGGEGGWTAVGLPSEDLRGWVQKSMVESIDLS